MPSFDHAEFYETCARVRTYAEHKSPKDFTLEHTKPLFNKHKLLTVHNLYTLHLLCQTFKILKYHTPISIFNLMPQISLSRSHYIALKTPKINLDISKNNFIFNACSLWNGSTQKIFSKPYKDTKLVNSVAELIIPGSQKYSDMTCPTSIFKNRLKNVLVSAQMSGEKSDWTKCNFSIR